MRPTRHETAAGTTKNQPAGASGEEWAWCYIDQLWFEKLVLS
jgi:hypothetical protein